MNGIDQQTATATEEAPPIGGAPVVGNYQCPKCSKSFDKPAALNMHLMRVHTPAGRAGPLRGSQTAHRNRLTMQEKMSRGARAAWRAREARGGRAMSHEEMKAKRRQAYRQQVKEYRARGLNAHGDRFKPGYGPQYRRRTGLPRTDAEKARTRNYQAEARARNIAAGLTSRGTPRKRGLRKAQRRQKARNYGQTYYWRKRAEQGHPVPPDKQHLLMTYENGAHPGGKLGMSATAALRLPKAPEKPAAPAAARVVMFCPCCGTNIQNVQTAVNFGD